MKKKFLAGLLVVALLLSMILPVGVALAANPTVDITVTAQVVAVTNTMSTWAMGVIVPNDNVYFSADNLQDDDYSQLENTGNVAIDVEIQGTDIEGGTYDWTLAATAGVEIYSLHANSVSTPTVYDIEVKSSTYNDLTTNLAVDATYVWSMKFVAPTEFNASDDGEQKSSQITLVASKYTG